MGKTYRHIHHLEPVSIANGVVGEDGGALEAGVRPFRTVRVGDIEAGYGDGLNLVAAFRHEALDGLLVVIAEDARHVERELTVETN